MFVGSANSTNNTGTYEAAMRLEDGGVAKVMHLHCANNTSPNRIITKNSDDCVFTACNIVRNTVTASSFGLIYSSAPNLSFVGSVIKGNADQSGKIFYTNSDSCKFSLFGCDVQAHSVSVTESGSASMSEVFLSLFATADCFAEFPFVSSRSEADSSFGGDLCVHSCPLLIRCPLARSFLVFSLLAPSLKFNDEFVRNSIRLLYRL
jgi:hypothetical protein